MKNFVFVVFGCFSFYKSYAQFVDNFDGTPRSSSQSTPAGWDYATGDGTATMQFIQKNGYASIYVDATKDKLGIWWALIKRRVSGVNLEQLMKPGYELRAEARIRVSESPRRVNLHFNNQRTTDFHSHLMEFDIPDTVNWYVISMTTRDWDTQPGDSINAQLALMDWGLEKYRVDIDYYKVDVVNRKTIGKDLGAQLPYHPLEADPASFSQQLKVVQDGMIDSQYPDMNFNNWRSGGADKVSLLTVSGTQFVILRWDLSALKGKNVIRSGLLELTTYSLERSPDFQKDFGMVHVTEILGGDPVWTQENVTWDKFMHGQPVGKVLNPQMTIDNEIPGEKGAKVYITISWPVLQRMINGRTLGLAIKPLGAVNASFYSMENEKGKLSPKLLFDIDSRQER